MIKHTLMATAIATASLGLHAGQFHSLNLEPLGTYHTNIFDEGAAEIVAHDPITQQLFVINADASAVDILSIASPQSPVLVDQISVAGDIAESGGVNSVAVHNGLIALAVENDDKQQNGWIAFYDTDGNYLNHVEAGALPDMVAFTHNGRHVLAANEGEPNDDYSIDPEGSITVVDLSNGVFSPQVSTAHFNGIAIPDGVRLPGPAGTTPAQDLEPEYIAVSHDPQTAWVTLQENNALARVDIGSATVTALLPLGSKDHSLEGNGLDASNRDDAINIQTWPVNGLYMPDAITAYRSRGMTYLVTANEGDAREYGFETAEENCPVGPQYDYDDGECIFIDESRIKDIVLDPTAFPDAALLQEDENLGRLKIANTEGDIDGDGDFDQLFSYGARSISIWSTDGAQVYDSGDIMEQETAQAFPEHFNSTNDDNDAFDNRSDDKGPEPEGVVVGKVAGRYYAFVGLERMGGIMIFDVTEPAHSHYVGYFNNRNFEVEDIESAQAGDLGPEGLAFIREDDSPTGQPLLVVGNEVSGTTTIYGIHKVLTHK